MRRIHLAPILQCFNPYLNDCCALYLWYQHWIILYFIFGRLICFLIPFFSRFLFFQGVEVTFQSYQLRLRMLLDFFFPSSVQFSKIKPAHQFVKVNHLQSIWLYFFCWDENEEALILMLSNQNYTCFFLVFLSGNRISHFGTIVNLLCEYQSKDQFVHLIFFNMRKQKSQTIHSCKEEQFKEQLSKIRNLLLQSLKLHINYQHFSPYKLTKIQLKIDSQKQNYIKQIDKTIRDFMRQDPTISYNNSMNIMTMLQTIFHKLQKQKNIHHLTIEKDRQMINQFKEQQGTVSAEMDYLKELLIQEQKQQQTWKNQALKHQKQIHAMKKQLELKRKENQLLDQLNKKLQLNNFSLTSKLNSAERDKTRLSKQYLQKSEQVSKLAEDFQSFKQRLVYDSKVHMNEQLQLLKLEMSAEINPETTQTSHKNYQSSNQHLFNHLFVGQVLLNEQEHRYFLIQTIQNMQKNAIIRTKLVYRWDNLNPINIHKYIDNISHLVLLIRTDRGQLIGAYSEGSFKAKTFSNQRGILISFNNQKVFKNIKKAIIYDESDIIFGNYELKIRSGQNKLMSNFGLGSGFYEYRGESVNTLLGEGKNRQSKMKHYEFYQIFFDE